MNPKLASYITLGTTLASTLLAAFQPDVQHFLVSHPIDAAILTAVLGILNNVAAPFHK